MKPYLLILLSLFLSNIHGVEYTKLFENDKICMVKVIIMPHEKIGLHYDEHSHIVFALKGGIITRHEADAIITHVEFPTNKAVFRPAETADKMHTSSNESNEYIELIIVQLK